jgi:hypothetical protein
MALHCLRAASGQEGFDMYSERMLTSELSPPLESYNVADWPGEAPFTFEDHAPAPAWSFVLGLRKAPALGFFILAIAAFLLNSMAVVLNPDVAFDGTGLWPAIGLVLLSLASVAIRRVLRGLNCCPASREAVQALNQRAARHGLKGPMMDAQARTNDLWRVGHVAQAQAVLDRI